MSKYFKIVGVRFNHNVLKDMRDSPVCGPQVHDECDRSKHIKHLYSCKYHLSSGVSYKYYYGMIK